MKKFMFCISAVFMAACLLLSGCAKEISVKLHGGSDVSVISHSTSASSCEIKNTNSMQNTDISNAYRRQIINNVNEKLVKRYSNINITNEWMGDKTEFRYVVLFGSLKSDLKQGIAQVIQYNQDCTKIISEQKFLEPGKHGSLRVIDLGTKDNNMVVIDADKIRSTFFYNIGFIPR